MTDNSARPRRVLVAADKFKGSLRGITANEAIARGLRAALPGADVRVRAVADGGDGTLDVLLANGFGAVAVDVTGPTSLPRRSVIGHRGDEAFIELAEICGLVHLPDARLDGMRTTTWGLGLAVRAALDLGVRRIHLAIGGSASTDGGLGLLAALGAVATDATGRVVTNDAAGLLDVTRLDLSGLDHRLGDVDIVAVTDVRNPLTGPDGAAHVYGPQKGLDPGQVLAVDAALERWAGLLGGTEPFDVSTPGAGAAGGVGAGIVGGLGGRLIPGAAYVLEAIGFDAELAAADLVVTGEGSWDDQSLQGKAPAEVLRRARAEGVPAAIIAGRVQSRLGLDDLGVRTVMALTDLVGDPAVAMRDAEALLETAGRAVGNRIVGAEIVLRQANPEDRAAIETLMRASVLGLFPAHHDGPETAAATEYITGLDLHLVTDGTYYVAEENGDLVACGGWSRRAKLHSGTGNSRQDDERLLDPATEPARVRAMFVRPDRTRRGLARQILTLIENAARSEGFRELILMATLPGVPLYTAHGFEVVEETSFTTPNGVRLDCAVMRRSL